MMITRDKLKIYKRYLGDIDSWARVGNKDELEIMNDDDWALVDKLLQGLELVEKGLASDSFKSQILDKLNGSCDSEKTKQELKSLVGKY